MMGIKEYETVRTVLLTEWSKIADQVPTTLRNAVDAGIAAVTGAIEKAQNEVISLLGNGDISDEYRRRKMDEVKQMVVETYTAGNSRSSFAVSKNLSSSSSVKGRICLFFTVGGLVASATFRGSSPSLTACSRAWRMTACR
jgi:hypothetical protein